MAKKNVLKLLTPQENLLLGGIPMVEPEKESDWHIPECVAREGVSIRVASRRRMDLGHMETSIMAMALGIEKKSLIMGLQELDPKTGQTIADPKIIGIWDDTQKEIIEDNRDLTKKLFDKLREDGIDLHLRQSKSIEGQNTGIEGR